MMYLNLFLLSALVVFVVDISGVMISIKSSVSRWLGVTISRLKPIDCSLCMTWWSGLIYLFCIGEFSIPNIVFVALLSLLSVPIGGIWTLIRDGLSALVGIFQEKINRE